MDHPPTMISGSTRYARSLGFVGGLGETAAESQRNSFERWTGLDVTGTTKPSGGSGITIGTSPSTIALLLIGAGIGGAAGRSEDGSGMILGAIKGSLLFLTIGVVFRSAANIGI